ncbi:unnamed protein product [Nippostrongylus brasiliensis]|uniref:Fatty-acid amide hydrolase 2 (inferred by orthology to a human protein) n=1 Tax=Nippostrongylus brasiliensis TaxID=27835 RepID=A0A0N4Y828_NIPBR|nr:unnamed protein product [Nippostrongylus brasiliensis]
MGVVYELVYLISRIYFLVVDVIFNVINLFKERKRVPSTNDPLLLISATEAVKRIANRKVTSRQLVDAYIHRIEQVNDLINAAVVCLFSEAREKADEVDRTLADMSDDELQEYVKTKPLLGVPYTVKDALAVKDIPITCGIYSQKGIKCTFTATVVNRMDAAGAILLAITNVPEVCMFIETANGIYGRTRNPYDLRRSAGGSSGGEGALIGAAGSLIGIGSDIGGSIRIPSFNGGIFGMKNTPGIIPLDGHVPEVKGFDEQMLRVGPMCRYMEDIPLLIEVMGADKVPRLRLSDPVDLKKVRVFYMEGVSSPLVQCLKADMRDTLVKADKGSVNVIVELAKLLAGKSVHTPGGLSFALIEGIDTMSKEEKAEIIRLRERLLRQINELLSDNGILLLPS